MEKTPASLSSTTNSEGVETRPVMGRAQVTQFRPAGPAVVEPGTHKNVRCHGAWP
jgi:hypothetical protein